MIFSTTEYFLKTASTPQTILYCLVYLFLCNTNDTKTISVEAKPKFDRIHSQYKTNK